MSVCSLPHTHCEIGYNVKHTVISDELYLHFFQMHRNLPEVVADMMVKMMIAIMDFAVLSCSSLMVGSGGDVKV